MQKISFALLALITFVTLQSCNDSKALELKVMTFNIRLDTPDDSLNNWQYRKDITAQVIKNYDVDILGTQEVLPNQMLDLIERLEGYIPVGVGREDGANKGEYSALFYKKDKFKEIKSGTFWLSQTPDIQGSMGWDAACNRVATWALLENVANAKRFFAINTHLDHVGQKARLNGVTLILEKARAIAGDLPIILTGDFNAEPESTVIQHVISAKTPNNLINSRDIAIIKNDAPGTFHDFGKLAKNKREYIDYIFVSKGIDVLEYKVTEEKMNNKFISDHTPVFAKITIN